MSVRGAKGAKAASQVGGIDGADAGFRQHIMNRYELMANYRKELASVHFALIPSVFAIGVLLTVMHFQAAGLAPLARTFLPPFPVMLVLQFAAAAITLRSVFLQSSRPFLALSALVTLGLLALSALYAFAYLGSGSKGAEGAAKTWWLAGALVHGFNAIVHVRAIYCGYLLLKLQEDKSAKR